MSVVTYKIKIHRVSRECHVPINDNGSPLLCLRISTNTDDQPGSPPFGMGELKAAGADVQRDDVWAVSVQKVVFYVFCCFLMLETEFVLRRQNNLESHRHTQCMFLLRDVVPFAKFLPTSVSYGYDFQAAIP